VIIEAVRSGVNRTQTAEALSITESQLEYPRVKGRERWLEAPEEDAQHEEGKEEGEVRRTQRGGDLENPNAQARQSLHSSV
jgi:hypothetical protein